MDDGSPHYEEDGEEDSGEEEDSDEERIYGKVVHDPLGSRQRTG